MEQDIRSATPEFDFGAFTLELIPLYRQAGYGERESELLAALASNLLFRIENRKKMKEMGLI